ncbi:MAG: hypothetical protein KY439_12515 [Actinobacteria bacterium]|nr:hypothetical protein [Actinomycetota bacterium]
MVGWLDDPGRRDRWAAALAGRFAEGDLASIAAASPGKRWVPRRPRCEEMPVTAEGSGHR